MIRVGIVGIGGFTGEVLLKILSSHQGAVVTYCSSGAHKGKEITAVYPSLNKVAEIVCDDFNPAKIRKECDVVFLCVPHTASMEITPKLLKMGKKVIDLSGDYRFKDVSVYEHYYQHKHIDAFNCAQAVYGLSELNRQKISRAFLLANPGCYPTVTILSLYPLLKEKLVSGDSIIVDAKSGVTGAGRKAVLEYHFCSLNENFYLYKPVVHQHVPEMEEWLRVFSHQRARLTFVPHLLPLDRGIYMTAYVTLKKKTSPEKLEKIYQRYYEDEPFVRFTPESFPQLKNVAYTNFCDIGMRYFRERNLVVVGGAIDNLMKGASSQAVQNMNIMYDYEETHPFL